MPPALRKMPRAVLRQVRATVSAFSTLDSVAGGGLCGGVCAPPAPALPGSAVPPRGAVAGACAAPPAAPDLRPPPDL